MSACLDDDHLHAAALEGLFAGRGVKQEELKQRVPTR
jgi:hypothetical protein